MRLLIYGEAGCGKTYSLGTALLSGKRLVCLTTDPNFKEGLTSWARDYQKAKKWTPTQMKEFLGGKIHIKTVIPTDADEAAAREMTKTYGRLQPEEVLKMIDPKKAVAARHFDFIMAAFNNFVDDKGVNLGNVSSLTDDTIFVVDNLTNLTDLIERFVKGNRPGLSLPERGQVQNWISFFVKSLTKLKSHVIMLAHPDIIKYELDGGVTVTAPRTSGMALMNWLPSQFTDVVFADRTGTNFVWVTDRKRTITRATNFPILPEMKQDFQPIFNSMKLSEDYGF